MKTCTIPPNPSPGLGGAISSAGRGSAVHTSMEPCVASTPLSRSNMDGAIVASDPGINYIVGIHVYIDILFIFISIYLETPLKYRAYYYIISLTISRISDFRSEINQSKSIHILCKCEIQIAD